MVEQFIIAIQIILIDIVMAADNAIIIGLIAASLECEHDGNVPIKPDSIKKRLKSIEKNIYN